MFIWLVIRDEIFVVCVVLLLNFVVRLIVICGDVGCEFFVFVYIYIFNFMELIVVIFVLF